jgi:hypothetical protein
MSLFKERGCMAGITIRMVFEFEIFCLGQKTAVRADKNIAVVRVVGSNLKVTRM